MGENIVILLKQNSQAIRDLIKSKGIEVCPCAAFTDAIWLDYHPVLGSVHGIGYPYEGMTREETLSFVQYEWKEYNTEVVECKDVHEFINEILKSGNGNET